MPQKLPSDVISRENILVAFPKNLFVDLFALNALAALYKGLDQLKKKQDPPSMLHFEMRQDASGYFEILITLRSNSGHPDQLEVSGIVSLNSEQTKTFIHFGKPYDREFTYRYDIRSGRTTFEDCDSREVLTHSD